MAEGKITGPELIADDVFARLSKLDESLGKLILQLNGIEAAAKNAFSTGQLNQQATRVNQVNREALDIIKEQDRLEKQLIRTRQRNELATEATARALARERVELQAQNREVKRQETANNQLVGAYRRLSAELNIAKDRFKDIAIEQGLGSEAARKQAQEVDRLQRRVRSADQAVGDFGRNVGNYKSAFSGLTSVFRGLVGAFGLVEGIRFGARFIGDATRLAREARGVEFAFIRLGESGEKAFEDIKRATRGALTDVDIKTSINEFDNFNISLEESGTLFEFLSVRALQTGRSIDSLRDSLVEGLSKESKLRIDNLGISTQELNEELEKTPNFVQAVANIAKREVAEAGDILDQAASSTARLAASFENAKTSLGTLFSNDSVGIVRLIANQIDRVDQAIKTLDENFTILKRGIGQFIGSIKNVLEQFPALNEFVTSASTRILAFINILTTPGIQAFSDLIKIAGATLSGFGAAIVAAKNETIDFVRALGAFSEIEFSLNPLDTFKQARDVLNGLAAEFVEGGKNVAEAFSDAYNEAINFETPKPDLKPFDDIKDVIDEICNPSENTRKKLEKVADVFEEEYQKALNTFEAFKKVFDLNPENLFETTELEQMNRVLTEMAEKLEIVSEQSDDTSRKLKEGFIDVFQSFSNRYAIDLAGFEALLSDKTDAYQDYAATAISISDTIYNQRAANLDAELQKNRQILDQILSNENATEEQKLIAQEKFAKREAAIKNEQAKAERNAALISVAVDTAAAIAKTIAKNGLPAAIPFVAIAAAIGATQAALIASQPLPQFFTGKGLMDNYEGLATWGERGREVRVTKDGQIEVSPDRTTPTFVSRDDLILRNIPLFKQSMENPNSEVFKRVAGAWRQDAAGRERVATAVPGYNVANLERSIDRGLRKGFKGVKQQINIINRIDPQPRVRRY